MKKVFEIILVMTVVFAAVSCSGDDGKQSVTPTPYEDITSTPAPEDTTAEPTDAPTTEPISESTDEPATDPDDEADRLANIFDKISQNKEEAVTGSYMDAVRSAAELLDWGYTTELSNDEIKRQVFNWLSDKGNDVQVAFAQKLASVDDAYAKLLGADAKTLLESAGCEDTLYPWSESTLESVETVMTAVGLR